MLKFKQLIEQIYEDQQNSDTEVRSAVMKA